MLVLTVLGGIDQCNLPWLLLYKMHGFPKKSCAREKKIPDSLEKKRSTLQEMLKTRPMLRGSLSIVKKTSKS